MSTDYNIAEKTRKHLTIMISIWMVTLPAGVAVHNFANFACLIYLILTLKSDNSWKERFNKVPTSIKLAWAFFALFVISGAIGGMLNTAVDNKVLAYIPGRLSMFIFPFFVTCLAGDQIKDILLSRKKLFFGILAFWSVIIISQYFFPWGIRDTSIVSYGNRPEGFYSNALTLAYVLLIIFPFIMVNALTKRTMFWGGSFALISAALLVNNSRMVLAVCLLLAASNVIIFLKGKAKYLTILAGIILCTTVLSTDNPISKRVKSFTEQSEETKYKGYADHRFVFWDIYIDMIKERPFFGHGPKLRSAYHKPYYEARGFGDFEKQYSAHNQYLQAAGNNGLIGLFGLLGWMITVIISIIKHVPDYRMKVILAQTVIGFMIAGLTQNAIQDSEVRQCFMLLMIACVAFSSLKYFPKGSHG